MATFEIAAAPFPYVERPVVQRRPCLIVGRPGGGHDLVWVLMITSADNDPIPGDVAISDLAMAGLKHPSVVRTAKIATVAPDSLKIIGELTDPAAGNVRRSIDLWVDAATDRTT